MNLKYKALTVQTAIKSFLDNHNKTPTVTKKKYKQQIIVHHKPSQSLSLQGGQGLERSLL